MGIPLKVRQVDSPLSIPVRDVGASGGGIEVVEVSTVDGIPVKESTSTLALKVNGLFSPDSLSGLVAWYDAGTVENSGGFARTLYDLSGNGRDALQTTAAQQWTIGSSRILPRGSSGYNVAAGIPFDFKAGTIVLICPERTGYTSDTGIAFLDSGPGGGIQSQQTYTQVYFSSGAGCPISDDPANILAVRYSASDSKVTNNYLTSTLGVCSQGSATLTKILQWEQSALSMFSKPMRAMLIYSRALSDSELEKIRLYYSVSSAKSSVIAGFGDSITQGFGFAEGAIGGSWLRQVQDGKSAGRLCFGISGVTLRPLGTAANYNAGFLSGYTNTLVVFIGTNDLSGATTAAQLQTDYQTFCSGRKSHNSAWKIVVCTILPRSASFSGGTDAASFETKRNDFNTWLRANYGTFADAIADLAADADIGPQAAASNTTWFLDGIHPTAAGHTRIASIVSAAITW